MVSGVVLAAAAVAILAGPVDDGDRFTSSGLRKVIPAIASLAIFTAAFARFGLLLPSLALFAFWFRWLGREEWRQVIPLTVVCSLALYLVFVVALNVQVPRGVLPVGR